MKSQIIDHITTPINFDVGIQRDGTRLDSQTAIDGQGTRWYMNRPRSMGGMKQLDSGNTEIVRTMYTVPKAASTDFYLGRASTVSFFNNPIDGTPGPEIDRTPSNTYFTPDPNNVWKFTTFTPFITEINPENYVTYIIAQVSSNGMSMTGTEEGGVFYGDINNIDQLQPIVIPTASGNYQAKCSGGVVTIGPYLFLYGNAGIVTWTKYDVATATFEQWNNTTINPNKIIAGFNINTGGEPAGLFFTVKGNMVLMTRVPLGTNEDNFSSNTFPFTVSIISPNSICVFNNVFYWAGNKKFFMFSFDSITRGVVKEIPNTMNLKYFYDNLNSIYQNRVWSVANYEYGEVMFFFPSGTNTECDQVVIVQPETAKWYDTALSRSAGVPANDCPYPVFADNQPINNKYSIWEQEIGTDKVLLNGQSLAIKSFVESKIYVLADSAPESDKQTILRRFEPDFVIKGQLNLYIKVRAFANSKDVLYGPYPFDETTEYIDLNIQGRQYSFIIVCNQAGSMFQMGKCYLNWSVGDQNPYS